MSQNGSFFLRLVGVVLMIGLLAAVGVVGYKSGVSQGIAQSPAVATAIASAQQAGQAVPAVPGYANGYYPGAWMSPHFGFFSFGSILPGHHGIRAVIPDGATPDFPPASLAPSRADGHGRNAWLPQPPLGPTTLGKGTFPGKISGGNPG